MQQNSNLALRAGWITSGFSITNGNGSNSIIVPRPAGKLFFRLTGP